MTNGEKPGKPVRALMTKSNLIWFLIIVIILLTVAVMIWASKQSSLSNDTPPLSEQNASPAFEGKAVIET